MSAIRRRARIQIGPTIWTVLISLGTAVTLLLAMAVVVLVATAPNWFGR